MKAQVQPPIIILVDDEMPILRALDREISQIFPQNQWEIVTFNTPEESLTFLEQNYSRVFLLISDLRMPQMRGSQLLEIVHQNYPEILTMLLTAYSDLPDLQRAVAAAIQSLIFKPWDPEVLKNEILKAWDLYRLRIEHRRIEMLLKQQLIEASEFQKRLFSSPIPTDTRYRVDVFYQPSQAYHVGGDIYQVHQLESGELILLLGDVSGHGIKPAFVSAMVKTLFQEYLLQEQRQETNGFPMPSLILEYLNRGICLTVGENLDIYVACSIIVYIPNTQTLVLSSGGQPPAFAHRGNGTIPFQGTGPALGIVPQVQFEDTVISVQPGDKIILLNDGLIEKESQQNRRSTEAIMKTVSTCFHNYENVDSKGLADCFLRDLGTKKFDDDATLIILEILPQTSITFDTLSSVTQNQDN